ncbi:hypothetical protein [Patulibacter defluvii]|uniref:hypothetical protein n=1 Tax=Patulibacter defluvii TaxID=3095358 RepID=UPI002A752FC1|nr:hypothetical protein [Patulibacter sp. DM4]
MFHTIDLTLDPREPTVLQRIVVLCRARGCAIAALDYRPARATLTLDGPAGRVALVGDRLRSLVGVLDVHGAALAGPWPGDDPAARLGPPRAAPLTRDARPDRSSGPLATRC